MLARSLTCPACSWRTTGGPTEAAGWLRSIGLLRRDGEPDAGLVAALLPEASGRMTCPACKRVGLVIGDSFDDDDDWQAAVLCEACRQPIDPERLEVFPNSKRCVACQSRKESGAPEPDEPEFCPHCGSYVELRVSRGSGLTRYKRFCTGNPSCRLG